MLYALFTRLKPSSATAQCVDGPGFSLFNLTINTRVKEQAVQRETACSWFRSFQKEIAQQRATYSLLGNACH